MAHVDLQQLHDVMQELIQRAGQVHLVVTADFPDVREKIREYVAEGEYAVDPFTKLFESIERAAAIVREMERVTDPG
jgi:hypothetical protein